MRRPLQFNLAPLFIVAVAAQLLAGIDATKSADDLYSVCVNDIKNENKELKDIPFSVDNMQTIPVAGNIHIAAKGACAQRIIAAFRMGKEKGGANVNVNQLSFLMNDLSKYEYDAVKCSSESADEAKKADTRLTNYIKLLLFCVPNKDAANRINQWLVVGGMPAKNQYQNIDFRFFEHAFVASDECQDRTEFVNYYKCFADKISEQLSQPGPDIAQQSPPTMPASSAERQANPTPVAPLEARQPLKPVTGPVSGNGPPALSPHPEIETTPVRTDLSVDPAADLQPGTHRWDVDWDMRRFLTDPSLILALIAFILTLGIGGPIVMQHGFYPGSGTSKEMVLEEENPRLVVVPDVHEEATLEPSPPISGRSRTEVFELLDAKVSGLQSERFANLETIKNYKLKLQQSEDKADALNKEVQTLKDTTQVQTLKLQEWESRHCALQKNISSLNAERDALVDRLQFLGGESERLKAAFPAFLALDDTANPLAKFWIHAARAAPKAHSRLEGALRYFKIMSDSPDEYGARIFELVNEIGVQLYALMDALKFDESQKREEAAEWQAALNKDGEGRFVIAVLRAETPIEASQMVRKDQRSLTERIERVCSWVVKDKDGRIALRAVIE